MKKKRKFQLRTRTTIANDCDDYNDDDSSSGVNGGFEVYELYEERCVSVVVIKRFLPCCKESSQIRAFQNSRRQILST